MENEQEHSIQYEVEDDTEGNTVQYLSFYVGREMYGIAVEQIKEVIEYHHVYRTPRVPPYLRGLINLRGEILPVIDLSYLFYRKNTEIQPSTAIIFLEIRNGSDTTIVGAVIDSVESVIDIRTDNIDSSFSFGKKIPPDYIEGVGRVDDRFILLLNIGAVINIDELSRFNSAKAVQ